MSLTFERGALFSPDAAGDYLQYYPDGVVVVRDGKIVFAGSVDAAVAQGASLSKDGTLQFMDNTVQSAFSTVIFPPTVSTHSHIFQPPGVPGELIREVNGQRVGWLPTTLRFETAVRQNPEKARAIARAKFISDIANGITGLLEYTTSSEEAVRIILSVAEEMGLSGRVKVGYVCMDQGVDFIDGVDLEASLQEALEVTERLLKDYPGQIVVIDRFPIACSSALRRKLVELAGKYNARYETHVDESEGEAHIHQSMYHVRIMDTLFADGVFQSGLRVGLAHAIHTNQSELERIAAAVRAGCVVHVHACPNSNAQLGSHATRDSTHVPFSLAGWRAAGVPVSFGLDRGAGRGRNILSEALWERGRVHISDDGARWTPSSVELLEMATLNGARCLDLKNGLAPGSAANYVVAQMDGVGTFYENTPSDPEVAAGLLIESGQDSRLIKRVMVNGRLLKQ